MSALKKMIKNDNLDLQIQAFIQRWKFLTNYFDLVNCTVAFSFLRKSILNPL